MVQEKLASINSTVPFFALDKNDDSAGDQQYQTARLNETEAANAASI